jgi:hypothetical protein
MVFCIKILRKNVDNLYINTELLIIKDLLKINKKFSIDDYAFIFVSVLKRKREEENEQSYFFHDKA